MIYFKSLFQKILVFFPIVTISVLDHIEALNLIVFEINLIVTMDVYQFLKDVDKRVLSCVKYKNNYRRLMILVFIKPIKR